MKKSISNILILCHSNIGDICCDLAVIYPLRQAYPRAHISILTTTTASMIAQEFKGVDSIITFDKHTKDKGFNNRLKLIGALRKERYNLVIVLKNTHMHIALQAPQVWSIRSFAHGKCSAKKMHLVDVYFDFLRHHNVSVANARWDFGISEHDFAYAENVLAQNGVTKNDTVVGFSPFALWKLKCWI